MDSRHVASVRANGKVPRGPDMGYHVAPIYWLVRLEKCFVSMRFELETSGMDEGIRKAVIANPPSFWFLTYSDNVNI